MANLDWMDDCTVSLMVPNVTEVALARVAASSNNANTTNFIFKHPQDIADGKDSYEAVIWSYTIGAKLPVAQVVDNEGNIKRVAVNLGAVQLKSLLSALGVDDDHLGNYMAMDRDTLAEECKMFEGLCVTCPMTGRVTDKNGTKRIQFKSIDLDFSDPHAYTDSISEHREMFGRSSLDNVIHKEAAYKRLQRPENAVTPVGAEEGDEIL